MDKKFIANPVGNIRGSNLSQNSVDIMTMFGKNFIPKYPRSKA